MVYLDGNRTSRRGSISATFNSIPDIPIARFKLVLPKGPHAILAADIPAQAKGSMCRQRLTCQRRSPARTAALVAQTTKVAVSGCPKKTEGQGQEGAGTKGAGGKNGRAEAARYGAMRVLLGMAASRRVALGWAVSLLTTATGAKPDTPVRQCPLEDPATGMCLFTQTEGGEAGHRWKDGADEQDDLASGRGGRCGERRKGSRQGRAHRAEDGETVSNTPQVVPGGLAERGPEPAADRVAGGLRPARRERGHAGHGRRSSWRRPRARSTSTCST